jgi:hypothetical protein
MAQLRRRQTNDDMENGVMTSETADYKLVLTVLRYALIEIRATENLREAQTLRMFSTTSRTQLHPVPRLKTSERN